MNVPVAERGSLLVDKLLDIAKVVRLASLSVDDYREASPGIMELTQETAVLHHVDKEALAATGGVIMLLLMIYLSSFGFHTSRLTPFAKTVTMRPERSSENDSRY